MKSQVILTSCLIAVALSGCITTPPPEPEPVPIDVLVDRVIEAGQALQVHAAMFSAARRDRDAIEQIRAGLLIAGDVAVIVENLQQIRERVR